MEAQRISLSQIHAAQIELLQEETDAHKHSLEQKLQDMKDRGDQGEWMCSQLPLCLQQSRGASDSSFMMEPYRAVFSPADLSCVVFVLCLSVAV